MKEVTKKILVFLPLLIILLLNCFHTTYPDEFDNILGGKLILEGVLPYSGFFSHHGPLAYFGAAIINVFSGLSFVKFRLLSAVFFLGLFAGSFWLIKKRVESFNANFFLLFIFVLGISTTFFWGQMFLADPLSGFLLIPAYAILFLKIYFEERLENKDLWIISIFLALAVLNSMTYGYAAGTISLISLIWHIRNSKITTKNIFRFGAIFATPYLVFAAYLLITGSLTDFIYQAIEYNQKYYIYNYPRPEGSTTFNPIRYAVVIFNNFINAYQPLLAGIFRTDFRYPLTATMAITNVFLWIYLLIGKKFLLLALSFLLVVYVNARGNPGDLRAADYQMAMYFILSLFNGTFLVFVLKEELEGIKNVFGKYVITAVGILFAFFWFHSVIFLAADFWRMNYSRYMGEMPLIYDRPAVAPILNAILTKDQYCWIGPFEFEEMFYAKCKLPSKYHWILPQFAGIEKIKNEIITDYERNPADIIVFRRNFSAFMQSAEYSKFYWDFLDKNYVRLAEIDPKLHFVNNKVKDFDLDTDFNFQKDRAEEIINKLVNLGYIDGPKESTAGLRFAGSGNDK